jgi:type IV pilus assembly protein PilA
MRRANTRKGAQRAFTLIELLISVAVVAILAAIAVPVYQTYSIRARISEALAAAGACTTSIADYLAANSVLPADVDAAGCSGLAPTQYIESLDVTDGVITVTMVTSAVLGSAAGGTLIMTPTLSPGNTISAWTCTAGTLPTQVLPGVCRSG